MKLIDILNEYKINQPNSNYKLVLSVVESYDDEDIMEDFLKEFPEGKNISKDQFFEFFGRYIDDMSEHHYIKQNWKYVESGGDDSVYDEDNDEEDEDDDEDYLEEYIINKPETNRPPALLEVMQTIFYCVDRVYGGEYITKGEMDDNFLEILTKGDIWQLYQNPETREYHYKCIKGSMTGYTTDQESESYAVFWEYNDATKQYFKIIKP